MRRNSRRLASRNRLAPEQLALRAMPSLLAGRDPAGMVRDVLSDLLETGQSRRVEESINHLLGTMACHAAVRAQAQFDASGNERVAAGNGAHRARRPMQSWPTDLGAACRSADLDRLFLRGR